MNARQRLAVLAILVFCYGALLRIALSSRQALWADEVFSLAMATGHSLEHPAREAVPALGDYVEVPKPVPPSAYQRYLKHEDPPAGPGRVIRAVWLSDTSPPLYYLLLNAWTRVVGTSDTALRLFSVFWALACFPVLWFIGRQVGGRATALTAGILFAAAPVSLYYSTEGRMYSMLWFFSLGTVGLTLTLYRRGFNRSLFALWTLTSAAGLLTHYFFAFVWLACFVWFCVFPGRLPRRFIGMGAVLTGLLVIPWFIYLPESLARWRITRDWLNGFPPWRVALLAPFNLAWGFVSGNGYWAESVWGERLAAIAFAPVGVGLWWAASARFRARPRGLLYLWLLAACVGPFGFDWLKKTSTMMYPRYVLAGAPAAFLLAGLGLSQWRMSLRMVLVLLILLAWMPGTKTFWRSYHRTWEPFPQVVASVEPDMRPSDLIIVHSIPSGVLGVCRYMKTHTEVFSWVGQLKQRRVPETLETLIAGRGRVVLIKIHTVAEPAPEEDWLRENATLEAEIRQDSAHIIYFIPRSGETFSAAPESKLPDG